MRKSISANADRSVASSDPEVWFDLEQIAHVELSSEDSAYPFENAITAGSKESWRAATPGTQFIKLSFDEPQTIKRVHLNFSETDKERSQEIALYAWPDGQSRRELVRQQWTFSPNGSTAETEDYYFDLKRVKTIELEIDPGRHDKHATATLKSIKIG